MRRLLEARLALAALPIALSIALWGGPALAHHSQASYDQSQEIRIEGTIARLDWKNPHIYLIVETTGPDGAKHLQQVEGLSITQMRVDGVDQDSLAPGTHVVVRANPNRGGAGKTVRGLDVTTAEGAVIAFYAASKAPAPTPADSIAGKWAPPLAETGKAFAAAARWPYSDAGRAAMAGGPGEGVCIVEPTPFLAMLNELRTIEIGDGQVVFRYDNSGEEGKRVVRLAAEHAPGVAPSVFGDAIGRWDGDTLVVDTVAFSPNPWGLYQGVPSSPGKHTVERLTLTEDHLRLRYESTVEDPVYLSGPASFSMLWDHRPDLEPSPPAEKCDPGIAHRYLED